MGRMIVYHGSYTEIQTPEIRTGTYTKDFGQGFYCTIIKEQAQRWAKRYNSPVVDVYSMLPNESLKIKEFPAMSEDWLDFIIACRHGVKHDYDIVIGAMANDQIYNFVSDYMDGIITREQFWALAKFKYPTHQINFCSDAALKCLKYEYCEVLIGNEWQRR